MVGDRVHVEMMSAWCRMGTKKRRPFLKGTGQPEWSVGALSLTHGLWPRPAPSRCCFFYMCDCFVHVQLRSDPRLGTWPLLAVKLVKGGAVGR